MIFFADTAAEVGDPTVVDGETATPSEVLECDPPHPAVNTTNAPRTTDPAKHRRARTFTLVRYRAQRPVEVTRARLAPLALTPGVADFVLQRPDR